MLQYVHISDSTFRIRELEHTRLKKKQLKATTLYSASVAAQWLGITKETVKEYLRNGKLEGKQIGPLKEWHVYGAGILRLRKEWGLGG